VRFLISVSHPHPLIRDFLPLMKGIRCCLIACCVPICALQTWATAQPRSKTQQLDVAAFHYRYEKAGELWKSDSGRAQPDATVAPGVYRRQWNKVWIRREVYGAITRTP
jgi:hypothetical protein